MTSLLNEVRDYSEQAHGGLYVQGGNAPRAGPTPAQVTADFARTGLTHRDARDELMREKMAFVANYGGTGATPFGEVHASDEDIKWLQRKRDTEAAANLDAWISSQFNTGDVARRKWLQEVYPEFFEVRERQLLDRAKFATRVNLLLLRGPKNEKDLILLWGLQTGLVQLDADWNKIGPVNATPNDGQTAANRFASGLMDFRRYKSEKERVRNAQRPDNPFGGPNINAGQMMNPFPFTDARPVVSSGARYPNFLGKLPI